MSSLTIVMRKILHGDVQMTLRGSRGFATLFESPQRARIRLGEAAV